MRYQLPFFTPGIVTLLLCVSFHINGTPQDLPSAVQISPAVETELRQTLQQPLPTDLNDKQIAQFYQKQEEASFKLNDNKERERVLRDWLRVQPGNLSPRWNLGRLLIEKGSDAQEGFALMQQIYRDTKEPIAAIRVRIKLAEDYLEFGKYQAASTMLNEAHDLLKEELRRNRGPEGIYWQVRSEMELAITNARYFLYQGKFAQALKFSQEGLTKGAELAATHDRHVSPWLANFSRNIHANAAVSHATIQMRMGALYEAEDSLRHALGLFKSYGFGDQHLWHLYRTTADLYFIQGRFQDSLNVSRKIKAMVASSGLKENTSQSLWTNNRVIKALAGLERWQEMVDLTDSIDKAIASEPVLKPLAAMTEYRAYAYLETGRTQSAIDWYRGHLNWIVANIGTESFQAGLTRGMYAVALSRNPEQHAQAKTEFEAAFKTLANSETLPDVYQEHPFYQKVKKKIYSEYLEFLSSPNNRTQRDIQQAFVVANALISSSVQKAIGEAAARASITQPGLGDIARADQDAKSELSFLYQYLNEQSTSGRANTTPQVVTDMRLRIQELERQRKENKRRIEKDFPDYYQLLQPRTPTAGDIATALKPDEYFLALVPTQKQTYVFGIGANLPLQFHRSRMTSKDVAEVVSHLRSSLDVAAMGLRAPRFRYEDSHRLYQDLIAPQAAAMTDKQHLIVAASGDLGQIPYAVLTTSPWTQGADKEAPWLIKSHGISQVSSAQSWLSLRKLPTTQTRTMSMMAWGDPAFAEQQTTSSLTTSGVRSAVSTRSAPNADLSQPHVDPLTYAKLPPLPETRDEVLALSRLMKSNEQSDVILGSKATRKSVLQASEQGLLKSKQVVVFATHGLLSGDLPQLSQPALAMAASGSSQESPLLTLQDVLGLRLNADWVILSACNTAGADGKNEEALSGLARGFFYAGTKSLLVTHWSVESESAMLITTETIKAFSEDTNATRAKSLQKSMLKVMQDPRYGHPTYWAPYALVGEGLR